MIAVIKEICIFIIIAQAILFFVPGQSYMKYVRILVGVIMILRITEPIFALVLDDENRQEIRDRIRMLEENIDAESVDLKIEDRGRELYENFEEEIKCRLDTCESNYEIIQVSFSEEVYAGKNDSGKEEIIITVSEKENAVKDVIKIEAVELGKNAEEKFQEEELKNMYGDCIGVDAEKIKIVLKQ